jgi:ABC-type multidrug transport system permease subunit
MYNLPAYFFSKIIIELPMQCLFPALLILVTYFMVGFQLNVNNFFGMLIVAVMQNNTGFAMGTCISCAVPDVTVALALVPLIILPLMFFSGFFIALVTRTLSSIMSAYTAASIHMHTHAHTHTHTHTHTQTDRQTDTHTHTHTYTQTYTCTHTQDDIPVYFQWIAYISPMKYAYVANILLEFGGLVT